ncbi:MAG: hypothetical protein ACR2GQ_03215 [Gemmatimonadota bacterium]
MRSARRVARPGNDPAAVAAVLLACFLYGACQRIAPLEPDGTTRVLIGVVVAGADSAFVSLGRVSGNRNVTPERGARLELSIGDVEDGGTDPGGGPVVVFEEGADGACGILSGFTCYRARLDGAAEPGARLVLRGALASGDSVRGTASVPSIPSITLEGAGTGDTVRAGPRTKFVDILGVDDEPGRIAGADRVVDATLWVGPQELTCPVRVASPIPEFDLRRSFLPTAGLSPPDCPGPVVWDSMAASVTLLGYDENFTAWTEVSSNGGTQAAFGVEGLDGVFGAATPRTFVMIVTP